jgi:hypothetical protein
MKIFKIVKIDVTLRTTHMFSCKKKLTVVTLSNAVKLWLEELYEEKNPGDVLKSSTIVTRVTQVAINCRKITVRQFFTATRMKCRDGNFTVFSRHRDDNT